MQTEQKLKNGFLDECLNLDVHTLRENNKDAYSLVNELNDLMYKIENEFVNKNCDNRGVYIVTVFNQIHISCQTYIILVERGLYCDSQVVLRAIYEKIFNLIKVIKDEKYINRLLKKSINENLSALKSIEKYRAYEIINEKTTKEQLEEYEKLYDAMNDIKNPHDNAKLAEELGLERQYIYYKLLSKYTHAELTILMQQLIFKEKGIIVNGSQVYKGKIPDEILRFVECVELIVKAMDGYLGKISYFKELQKIELKYEYIWKK